MSKRIDIRFTDGTSVSHLNILNTGVTNGILSVTDVNGDQIHYGPAYWAAYVIDPKGDDPLNFK